MEDTYSQLADVVAKIIADLASLDDDQRARVLRTVASFYGAPISNPKTFETTSSTTNSSDGGEYDLSPKDFMLEKRPQTDGERLACLGFYLSHFRNITEFKTEDLVELNNEAKQLRFNAIEAAKNAVKRGLLLPSGQGRRQLSALGEEVVKALPDRDAVKNALINVKPRRKIRRKSSRQPSSSESESRLNQAT